MTVTSSCGAEKSNICSQCEFLGEIDFHSFERNQKDVSRKIFVRHLPEGINERGITNLFLSAGKPLSINFFPKRSYAFVEFRSMKEVELAIRDLNDKPPFFLKISLAAQNAARSVEPHVEQKPWVKNEENYFSTYEVDDLKEKFSSTENFAAAKKLECNIEKRRVELKKLFHHFKTVNYDPSIRIYQKKLDVKSSAGCISLGRGFMNMGDSDRFVGNLQAFTFNSESWSPKDSDTNYVCENCNSITRKFCGKCLDHYCSKQCLSRSNVSHRKNHCLIRSNELFNYLECKDLDEGCSPKNSSRSSSIESFSNFGYVPINKNCIVVMTMFYNLQTVFVRPIDCGWEEKFSRLCNDVAAACVTDDKFETTAKVGDLCAARYYEDLCFYRAQIHSFENERVNVTFIDFGNRQTTRFEDLKPLPDPLKQVPGFGVKVHLANVPQISSIESVKYYNKLVIEEISLILSFEKSLSDGTMLKEKDSRDIVGEKAVTLSVSSWRRDPSVLSKLGEVFYRESLKVESFKIGEKYNLLISHFCEKEFVESGIFWAVNVNSDYFFHAKTEMKERITEYCEFLRNDSYLPRVNEVCLALEKDEWHRCINLGNCGTTCSLFFVDDGHISCVDTTCIRKILIDFLETPSLAVPSVLSGNLKLKTNSELQSKVIDFMKNAAGEVVNSAVIREFLDDAYHIFIPKLEEYLIESEID